MKARLLLTSVLFLFVQITTMHAQETIDVAKITCAQILREQLPSPTHDVVLWLSGYYNGKRNSTIITLQKINDDGQSHIAPELLQMRGHDCPSEGPRALWRVEPDLERDPDSSQHATQHNDLERHHFLWQK